MRVSFSYKSFEALAAHLGSKVEEVQDIEQLKISRRLAAKWNREDRERSSLSEYIARLDEADRHLEKRFRASGDAEMWRTYACHVNRNRNRKKEQ